MSVYLTVSVLVLCSDINREYVLTKTLFGPEGSRLSLFVQCTVLSSSHLSGWISLIEREIGRNQDF